jgi:predicted MFS family arabinose efflux permease
VPVTAVRLVRAPLDRLLPADPTMRLLGWATLATTFGNGLFFTVAALFFTRSVGLSVAQVGLGLTIAGLCGVVAGVPFGHLADRHDPRTLLVALTALEALATLSYVVVHSVVAFVLVASAAAICDRGASAVRNTLIVQIAPPEERVRGRAQLRALTNVGIGIGAAIGALALHADTRDVYLALVVVDAATFALCAALLARLPRAPRGRPAAARERASGRLVALRDRPYLVVTVLSALLALQFGILEIALPLWVADHTDAPLAVAGLVLLLNTGLVVLLQVRASRGTDDASGAARACARAGVLLALACALFAAAAGLPAPSAVAVLVAGGVLLTAGEVLSSAGGWGLSYALARPDVPGQYQGVFNSGFAAAIMLGPAAAAALPLGLGVPGWLALGAIFVLSGAALVPASRWAARTLAATA